ncbi:hypothetical protein SAMN05444166_0586 [Singulisphaera sp. GP187]|nr:hypothetical protein SAMN05444166_0586 [Singulisphaera sp. GP187]
MKSNVDHSGSSFEAELAAIASGDVGVLLSAGKKRNPINCYAILDVHES